MHITNDAFRAAVIAQDDDKDYDEFGWVACVFPNGQAAIGQYGHCSCYGTFEALCAGGIGDYFEAGNAVFTWVGTVSELVAMARRKADPAIPHRESIPEDYDHDHLIAVYEQVIAWAEKQ